MIFKIVLAFVFAFQLSCASSVRNSQIEDRESESLQTQEDENIGRKFDFDKNFEHKLDLAIAQNDSLDEFIETLEKDPQRKNEISLIDELKRKNPTEAPRTNREKEVGIASSIQLQSIHSMDETSRASSATEEAANETTVQQSSKTRGEIGKDKWILAGLAGVAGLVILALLFPYKLVVTLP